jgi:2-dehydro-3-deoxyphosphogluconate aldolase/(4S)-4-hydroxy-2-oxoglutarate aldolase
LLTSAHVADAHASGAAFGVAPGCNPRTIRAARDYGLPFGPGVATPTDIEIAVENECRVLKFFPAESTGGLAYLQTLAAPFAHLGLSYFPLGGIDARTLAGYLRSPLVLCVGGSWLVRGETIRSRDWPAVTRRAAEAAALVRNCQI